MIQQNQCIKHDGNNVWGMMLLLPFSQILCFVTHCINVPISKLLVAYSSFLWKTFMLDYMTDLELKFIKNCP